MQTIFITGGNSGLGFALARELLAGGYQVIIACRNPGKAEKARRKLISLTGKDQIEVSLLDLASPDRIRQSVQSLRPPIDAMVCNAGISYSSGIRYTKDGYEETFGVNHLGHFLLTHLMLKKFSHTLKRIFVVSSNLHNPETSAEMFPAPAISSINELAYPDTAEGEATDKNGRLAYVNSKLCNILFTYRLDELLKQTGREDIHVNAYNPGFIPSTNLARHASPATRLMMRFIMPHMKRIIIGIRTAKESAADLAKLVTEVEVSGKYFDGLNEIASSPLSYDRELSSLLWDESIKMTGLQPQETIIEIS